MSGATIDRPLSLTREPEVEVEQHAAGDVRLEAEDADDDQYDT